MKLLYDVVAETSPNQQRRKGKQQVSYALSAVIHEMKTLREGEDEVVKRDNVSSEKQTQNFDVLDRQDVELVVGNQQRSLTELCNVKRTIG
jgi:hypothetical protein